MSCYIYDSNTYMNKVKHTQKRSYRSPLREEQAQSTRERICAAASQLLGDDGSDEAITFRAVAELAGVTEMTVYRHFPTRQELMQGLWEHLNAQMGADVGMPRSLAEMLGQHGQLFAGFDKLAPQIIASLATPKGREMRASVNDERQAAFRAIVAEIAPDLDTDRATRAAALMQLLHSAHAWASLQGQWGMNGKRAGEATRWLIELIINDLKEQNP